MSHAAEFLRAKLALGSAAVIVGVPAFVFAVFGWAQSSTSPFSVMRLVCILGGLGAILIGGLQLKESLHVKRAFDVSAEGSALDFLVAMESEEEQRISF
jgi:hypothetical protein